MRHWWESHFGLLWKHFFERVLLPLRGLQKCNQQSYVLARRVVVLWSMRSNSSILQFPKQKVGKGKTNSRKRFFDEWILTHLFCWRSFHHERISQVVFFTEQISQYTIQLGGRCVASSILDSVCWRQKLSWREMFSVFWNLFAFAASSSSMLTWPCHALVSVNIKDFFSSLASLANMCRVFQNKSWS